MVELDDKQVMALVTILSYVDYDKYPHLHKYYDMLPPDISEFGESYI